VVKLQIGHTGTETWYSTAIWDFSLLRSIQAELDSAQLLVTCIPVVKRLDREADNQSLSSA